MTNFDYLGLRNPQNKLYKRVSMFLDRNGENKWSPMLYTDYMHKIDSKLHKTKRVIIVT